MAQLRSHDVIAQRLFDYWWDEGVLSAGVLSAGVHLAGAERGTPSKVLQNYPNQHAEPPVLMHCSAPTARDTMAADVVSKLTSLLGNKDHIAM